MTSGAGERHDGGGAVPGEDVETRAARLGITRDRVLRELRGIAFTKISDVVEWEDGKLRLKPVTDLRPGQLAAIAEIAASASSEKIYRVKMHDKRPAIELLGRYLRMQPPKTAPHENTSNEDDPIDLLIAEFDRLEAQRGTGSGAPRRLELSSESGTPG